MRATLLFLLFGISPADALRGPYLVGLTTGSARICWRETEDQCGTWKDLEAGTDFEYEVKGKRWRARTFPPAGSKIKFAAFGDSGTGKADQLRVANAIDSYDPHFAVVLGDIVYPRGADKHYDQRYFAPYAKLLSRIPFYPVIGNHDYGNYGVRTEKSARRFSTYEKIHHRPRYYSFSIGNAEFFSIDTNREGFGIKSAAAISEGSAQWKWLNAALRDSKAHWKIALIHVPLYSSGKHGGSRGVRNALSPLFKKYEVDFTLQGHDHHYERTKPIEGTVYAVVGTGGARIRGLKGKPRENWSDFALASFGFLGVEIEETRLRMEFFDADGEVRDYAEIIKLK